MTAFLRIGGLLLLPGAAWAVNVSGDWTIESSVGTTPIRVNCTLIQSGNRLSGTCTPVMENPVPSELTGTVDGSSARWDYDVIFNGSPGHVGFLAQSISEQTMTGTLLLSGNPAPFTAKRRGSDSSGP